MIFCFIYGGKTLEIIIGASVDLPWAWEVSVRGSGECVTHTLPVNSWESPLGCDSCQCSLLTRPTNRAVALCGQTLSVELTCLSLQMSSASTSKNDLPRPAELTCLVLQNLTDFLPAETICLFLHDWHVLYCKIDFVLGYRMKFVGPSEFTYLCLQRWPTLASISELP